MAYSVDVELIKKDPSDYSSRCGLLIFTVDNWAGVIKEIYKSDRNILGCKNGFIYFSQWEVCNGYHQVKIVKLKMAELSHDEIIMYFKNDPKIAVPQTPENEDFTAWLLGAKLSEYK